MFVQAGSLRRWAAQRTGMFFWQGKAPAPKKQQQTSTHLQHVIPVQVHQLLYSAQMQPSPPARQQPHMQFWHRHCETEVPAARCERVCQLPAWSAWVGRWV
jgi:hypothetical protein